MNNNLGRYELKYVLNECHYTSSMLWLNTNAIRCTYPERYVNSLYFDDVSYQSVRDNLAGISDRKKIRLRWYHDHKSTMPSDPKLEIKVRNGRLGSKHFVDLPELKNNLLLIEIRNILEKIQGDLLIRKNTKFLFDAHYIPTLYVCYKREYYEDRNGLRITIDKNIKFHHPHPFNKLNQIKPVNYHFYIMELKFPLELKNKVADMIRTLHLSPKRHSKYLVGLAMLGNTQYI